MLGHGKGGVKEGNSNDQKPAATRRIRSRRERRQYPTLDTQKKGWVPGVVISPIMSLTWFLDDAESEQWLASRQGSSARAAGMLPQDRVVSIADYYRQRGDLVRARAYADSARDSLEVALRTATDSAPLLGRLGWRARDGGKLSGNIRTCS